MRRVLDGRTHLLVPDGGGNLSTHGWAGNLAHAVLLAVDKPEISAGKSYNCGDLDQLSIRQIVDVIAGALGSSVEQVSVPWEFAGSAKVLSLGGRYNQLMDLSRLRDDLGYRDVLSAPDALAKVARWYAANPPDASLEEHLGDPFNYAWEDAMIAASADTTARWHQAGRVGPIVERAVSGQAFRPHPYAHPKDANSERDHRGR